MKTRLIPSWAGKIIVRALDIYAPRVVALIPSPALQAGLQALFLRVSQIITAISDADPQNAEQVQAVISRFISEDAIPLADGVIDERIARIENEKVRHGLTLLAEPVVDTMRLLADDNPDNAAQAEEVLDRFILNPAAQEFVVSGLTVPILEKVIKEPFLLAVVLEALEQGIAQGAIELADIDVFNRERTVAVIVEAKERALAAA